MNWHWLQLVAHLTPVVLSLLPGAAPLAPLVAVAIQTAEAIPNATGDQKLRHAQELVTLGAAAINVAAGHQVVDPALAATISGSAISTIVDEANRIHAAHAPAVAGV